MTRTVSRFLDLAALSSLAHMRFTTRHRIEGGYSGRHASRVQGGAGEFVDYREYTPGEDLRRLDWKILGRTGRAYVRLFQDDTNLLCTLVIDASASMLFSGPPGSRSRGSKLEYVQYLATALSEVISRGQDQVGLAVVADGLRQFLPTGSAPAHVRHLQDRIETLKVRRHTRMGDALRDLSPRLRRRGVLVLFSDFLDDELDDTFAAVRLFRQRQCELVVLHVVHPDEERLPEGRAFRFLGMEQMGSVDCSPAEIRSAYEERFEAHCSSVRSLAVGTGCDYRRVSTAVPWQQTLSQFLVARS